MRVAGAKVLVTGANRGLGKASSITPDRARYPRA